MLFVNFFPSINIVLRYDAGISSGVGVEDDFKCPTFLVSTGSALVVMVESKLFYELSPENRRGLGVLGWGSAGGGVVGFPFAVVYVRYGGYKPERVEEKNRNRFFMKDLGGGFEYFLFSPRNMGK